MKTNIVTHQNPAWRDKSDFIIVMKIPDSGASSKWQWEQLWAKQIKENRFEICCIPFFVNDLALGDSVETEQQEEKKYAVSRIIKKSGRYTFRVWFLDTSSREEIINQIEKFGCLIEQRSSVRNLIAIDAAKTDAAQRIANFLYLQEETGKLNYETGLTS